MKAQIETGNYGNESEAFRDLIRNLNSASCGIEQCWAERSRPYDNKLKERFDELAEQPERSPLVEHIRKGMMRRIL